MKENVLDTKKRCSCYETLSFGLQQVCVVMSISTKAQTAAAGGRCPPSLKAELVQTMGLDPPKGQETHSGSFSEAAVSFPVGLINI